MALLHLHRRKRIHLYKEIYPHPHTYKRVLDRIVYIMAVIVPVMTIPQLYTIWSDRAAEDVSLATWITYVLHSITFLLYGFAHKEKPLVLMYSFQLIVNAFIVVGILLF